MHYPGRVLGIDYGSKRIGVAASDPTRTIAQAVGTVENTERAIDKLLDIIGREGIQLIVVGMPYSEDGGKGKKAVEVDAFIEKLKTRTTVEVDTWDESFSSVNAHQTFIDIGMRKRKRQQKRRVDVMAARLMLQEYLDNHK